MTDKQKIEMLEKNQQKLINALVKKSREHKELVEKHKDLWYKFSVYSLMLSIEERNAADVIAESIHKKELIG